MPNRLERENSPYLIQHADNPVDWYPWGEEALGVARTEDKPIFLSIGYAACHWCHVMAHESFEDHETAVIMNEHFVNIKVDREERPDLDSIYMDAIVAMTGQGGWPMSVFLTPDGKPFYGGTYFPPERRYNMPSFREVLISVHGIWENEKDQILTSSQRITEHLTGPSTVSTGVQGQNLQTDILEKASISLSQVYDWKHGGWGNAPKFPQPMAIEYLLRRAVQGDKFALEIATHALFAMAKGGMYDVIGGGFARYSTDNDWQVPHFEKMLYDNALLARVYLHGYLLTGETLFRRVCEETLGFIAREMTHPLGGFYSSIDADSEGIEGKYYLWTPQEIRDALPDRAESEFIMAAYGVSENGNFEGSNILQRVLEDDELAEQFSLPVEKIPARLTEIHVKLLRVRAERIPPSTDDKILVEWNALAVLVFLEAGRYLGEENYKKMATRNIQFVIKHMHIENRLFRSWRHDRSLHNAYLPDYAGFILGLLSLYQSHPNSHWYQVALQFTEEMQAHFIDPQGGFFDTRDDHEELLTRPKSIQDSATPSGNALAATALLQLAAYTGRADLRNSAVSMLSSIQDQAARYPTAYGQWLCALDFALAPTQEVVILGEDSDPKVQLFLDVLWKTYRPNTILARSTFPVPSHSPPLLEGRTLIKDQPTAYVCHNFTCKLPVISQDEFLTQLDG